MNEMSIGQLSKLAGVKVTTIRYYESIGLIAEPKRSPSGRRLYGQEAVQILSFVRHGRDLGFSMNAIERLLTLQQDPDQSCDGVDSIVREQLNTLTPAPTLPSMALPSATTPITRSSKI